MKEGQIGEIEDVILHPLYRHARAYNDIAVIKLRPSRGNSKFHTLNFCFTKFRFRNPKLDFVTKNLDLIIPPNFVTQNANLVTENSNFVTQNTNFVSEICIFA